MMKISFKQKSFRKAWALWLVLGLALAAAPMMAATVRIYVANRAGTTIDVIDPATNKVVETLRGIESPEVVRFSPDGSRLYIATRSEDFLEVRGPENRKDDQARATQRLGQRCGA